MTQGALLHSIWVSAIETLRNWRTLAGLIPAAIAAAKELGWLEASYIPAPWLWWGIAILALFANNVSLTHRMRECQPPRPDIGAADAFKTIVLRSKRAKELLAKGMLNIQTWPESHLTEAGKIEQRLKMRIRGELLDRLRQGHVKAWGEPRDSKAEKEIEKEEWARMELSLDDREIYRIPPSICAMSRSSPGDPRSARLEYAHVRFCAANIFGEFPLMWRPRRVDYVPLTVEEVEPSPKC